MTKYKSHTIVYSSLLILLSYLPAIISSTSSTASPKYAMEGCEDKCGKVRIPYPFGMGAECSLNEWYTVDCDSSTPYLRALNRLQVLGVDLENQTVTVNMSSSSIDHLGESPYFFSKLQNKFVFEGCGNAVLTEHGSVLTGCSATCNDTTNININAGNGGGRHDHTNNNCLGMGCCQTTLPHHLKSYYTNLTGSGSAVLVDKEYSYALEGSWFRDNNSSNYVPISLLWTISDSDSEKLSCCSFMLSRIKVDKSNGTSIDSWKCMYSGYAELKGNPYLGDGCHFASLEMEICAKCNNVGGYCVIDIPTYGANGLPTKRHFTCALDALPDYHESKSSPSVILGVSVGVGVLFLVATIYVLYKVIKKTKERRLQKRFFKRNGGLLLKQQEKAEPSLVYKTILFISRELEKATDNFNENRILGRGGQGTVYKEMLVDGRIVAVKKSKLIDESQLNQFINELVILSQVSHKNVVKLLGCCLETDVPLLVSEFIPNGTLYDRLHNGISGFPFFLNMRLQIATEVAGALAYLHSTTSIPIYHRDIKTTNILLDDKYFGTSRFVSLDQTHLTTLVKGTFGYLDSEYFQSSQFTEKSNVYTFGVVLVELLTGEKPISITESGEHKSVATQFMLAVEEGRVLSFFDAIVVREGSKDDLLALANLAMRCLNLNGKYRLTMKEVAMKLETIRASHIPYMIQSNIMPMMMYEDELSMLSCSESSSTFLSFNSSISKKGENVTCCLLFNKFIARYD